MPPRASRLTLFATALTCGLLLALAAMMLSARFGIGVVTGWRELTTANANGFRGALCWWAIAGAGFVGSFVTGVVTSAVRDGRRRPHMLQWLGALLFVALAAAPYFAVAEPAPDSLEAFTIDAAAFGLGAVAAFCGAWLGLPK